MKKLRLAILLAAACLGLHASQAQQPPSPFPPLPPAPEKLTPGDALFIRITGVGGGLPEYREIVDSEGRIELPYLGMVSAAGKAIDYLETEMAEAYATARLGTSPSVKITYAWHFDPAPDRATLNRADDPRRPVPAGPPPSSSQP